MIGIVPVDEDHADAVLRIMQSGIDSRYPTFKTSDPTPGETHRVLRGSNLTGRISRFRRAG